MRYDYGRTILNRATQQVKRETEVKKVFELQRTSKEQVKRLEGAPVDGLVVIALHEDCQLEPKGEF